MKVIKPLQRLTTVVLASLYISSSSADSIHVAVASNFLSAARHLAAEYEAATEVKVTLSSASSGKIYTQIIHGAPYDVFLSGDTSRPTLLEKNNKIVSGTRRTYAIGRLVFWSNQAGQNCAEVLRQGKFKKLAIANPKFAPYGSAAKEVLIQMQHFGSIELISAENIAQTLLYLKSRAADAGFISASQALEFNEGCQWAVDDSLYKPIKQQLVVLAASKNLSTSSHFVSYLFTPEARAVIVEYGYTFPE